MKLWRRCLVALERSTIKLQQVPTSLSVAAMLPHLSMNDTPSYFEQSAVLPHSVHLFHVLIFHFRQQTIIWRLYGVIAEVFDHSFDRLDTCKTFAFSHTGQCLLATNLLRHLVRWGNTMLPRQVPYRATGSHRHGCDYAAYQVFWLTNLQLQSYCLPGFGVPSHCQRGKLKCIGYLWFLIETD